LLRENPLLVYPEFHTVDLDRRFAGWDPPAQARAVLCHFASIHATSRWEVLRRVPDRCSPSRWLRAVEAPAGETVRVPASLSGEVIYVRIHGAGVSGLERLEAMAVHARSRWAIVNGDQRYRLIPETAEDGLLLRADPAVPQARTLAVTGAEGDLRYEFFAMRVRPPRTATPPAERR
jgi:hypothetical protein